MKCIAGDRLVLVRPRIVGWAVDFYSLQGRWLATVHCHTRIEAQREARKQRARMRKAALLTACVALLLLTTTAQATTTGSSCTTDDSCPPGWTCSYRCSLIATPDGEVSQHCTQGVCEEYRASHRPQEPPPLRLSWWERLWAWLLSQLSSMQEKV